MDSMTAYKGRLTSQQIANIVDYRANGVSVRKTAELLGYPYAQVRGYAEWYDQALTDLPTPPKGPRILVYDIETAPALAWMWSAYKANIVAMEQDWYMLSVAFKWLGEDETHFFSIAQDPEFTPDSDEDYFVVARLHKLFDQADILIAHNGDRFDQRKANARFLSHGLGPPSPYQTIDTKKEAARYFANYSNSLKELTRLLDLERKQETTGFSLWRSCMAGDPAAWEKMEEYNRQDVKALEALYLKLRPFIGTPGKQAHPNLGHWNKGRPTCPKCGSERVQKRGIHRTIVSEFQTIQCKDCKGYSRSRIRRPQRSPDDRVTML